MWTDRRLETCPCDKDLFWSVCQLVRMGKLDVTITTEACGATRELTSDTESENLLPMAVAGELH